MRLLGVLLDDLVFVGGCTTGLLITDAAAGRVRPTNDVDAIVNVVSYAGYASLAGQARALGLVEDTSPGAPLCRWRGGGVIIDIMPVESTILGFSNRWYPAAIVTAQTLRIAGCDVKVITAPLFVATKLEAFDGRGSGDVVASHDLEDVVTVVDGRPEIVDEVADADAPVRAYVASRVRRLLADQDFTDAIPGFLQPDLGSQARRGTLEQRLRALANLR